MSEKFDPELVVHFLANFFYFFFYLHLVSFAFSSLHLPSLVKAPKGGLRGFLAILPRAGWAGWSRLRVAGGEIDCAYVSHA
jgi:hypothetical protein